jgi:hypothetical protein
MESIYPHSHDFVTVTSSAKEASKSDAETFRAQIVTHGTRLMVSNVESRIMV